MSAVSAADCCGEDSPPISFVRETADRPEGIVAVDLWPLATHQEMLFIE